MRPPQNLAENSGNQPGEERKQGSSHRVDYSPLLAYVAEPPEEANPGEGPPEEESKLRCPQDRHSGP